MRKPRLSRARLRNIAVFAVPALWLLLNLWPLPQRLALAEGTTTTEPTVEDQETARKALENKEILPLGEVLARIQERYSGDVIEIELERKLGRWVYEIEIIGDDGKVREIDVDGKSLEVLADEVEP